MYAATFDYYDPSTVTEAIALLKQHGGNAKLLAGGQSLIPLMKLRLASPAVIVDLGRVKELTGIREEAGSLVIGAMTTHHAIATSPLVQQKTPLLAHTAAAIGDIQVRNRGTIGGSIAHADPAADWPAALLALDATVTATGNASRTIGAAEFFVDLLTTALEPGEILTDVRVPIHAAGGSLVEGSAYEKVRQPASGFALVGIAVQIAVDKLEKRPCRYAAVAVTGVSVTPYRASATEKLLVGRTLDTATIAAAAEHIADGVEPLADMHASSEFRGHLARVHAARAIARASQH